MRIEELSNNLYIKETDTIEKYLLNIIKEYFKDSNEAIEGSKEYIIREAVNRLKTEMDYNALGVLSITLPDGRVLKGDVSITLDDLGGEPAISPKLSAFNVDFGTIAGTACEGNDPRLYNARKPIQHEHEISDIRGLDGIISTITNQMERLGVYNHNHTNKDLLDILVYSGNSSEIDLTLLETLEPKINQITNQIRQDIENYIQQTETEIETINTKISEINKRIDDIYSYIVSQIENNLELSKVYTDNQIEESITEFKNYLDENYVKKDDIEDLINIAQECYTLVGTEKWNMSDLSIQAIDNDQVAELELSKTIYDELFERSIEIGNDKHIVFDFSIQYEKNNKTYKQPLPYLETYDGTFQPYMYPLSESLTISGYVQTLQKDNNVLYMVFQTNDSIVSEEIINTGKVVCDIYAKSACSIPY